MRFIILTVISFILAGCHSQPHHKSLHAQLDPTKEQANNTINLKHDYSELVSMISTPTHSKEDSSNLTDSIKLSGTICQEKSCHAIVVFKGKTYFLSENSKLLNTYTALNISQNEIVFKDNQSIITRVKI